MATQIPAALKSADVARFAIRAAQLEKAKPIVAYWCNFYIVDKLLKNGLHTADQECLVYTTTLMDKLEKVWSKTLAADSKLTPVSQFKSDNSTNDAVVDDMAGKAYVERFGLETFQRADNAVRANKASRQTADTFQASSTFLDVLQIWPPVDPEITAKIKYAKYHAIRIAKALKAGEDPNLSNPVSEPEPEEQLPALDPNDAEVQMLNGAAPKPRQPSVVEIPDDAHRLQRSLAQSSSLDESLHPSRETSVPRPPETRARQPSVVEVPDEAHKIQSNLARQSSVDESLHPSRTPSVPPQASHDVSPLASSDPTAFYSNNGKDPVSPVGSSEERKPSIGGNYFPAIPGPSTPPIVTPPDQDNSLNLPSAPSEPSLPQAPSTFAQRPPSTDTEQSQPPPGGNPGYQGHFLPTVDPAAIPPNFAPHSAPRQPVPQAPPQLHQPRPLVQQNLPLPTPAPAPTHPVVVDDEAIMKAQKHARWAISALNFEDVPTAIRELRGALQSLGG